MTTTPNAITFGGITIPGQQAQPPAGHDDIAFRPACNQLGEIYQANGLTAYTLTMQDGTQRILFEMSPQPRTQAELWMDSAGICKIQGIEVPTVWADQVPTRQVAQFSTMPTQSPAVAPTTAAPTVTLLAPSQSFLSPAVIIGAPLLLAIGVVIVRQIRKPPAAKSQQATAKTPDKPKSASHDATQTLNDIFGGNP